jgi:peptidoglycan/LPS O-acetylase OafA/YrhL
MTINDNRVFGLDVLRALAILFVVYGHGYYQLVGSVDYTLYHIPVFDGVSLFFVLSGFLIGRILLKTIARDDFNGQILLQFWVRRWFRTLPNYFLVLTFVILSFKFLETDIILLYKSNGLGLPEDLFLYFFFAQNIASPHPEFFKEAWSLTIEEWFYLTTPVPLYLLSKLKVTNQHKFILYYIILVILTVTVFRIFRTYNCCVTLDDFELYIRKVVITRMDSLMFGVLGAYLSLYKLEFWKENANKLFVIGIILIILDKILSYGYFIDVRLFYLKYFSLTIFSIATLFLLPKLSTWTKCHGRLVSIITFISLISYSMYLLNLTPIQIILLPVVMRFLWDHCTVCGHGQLLVYIIYWVLTILGASILYWCFERPMTAQRDKWHIPNMEAIKAFIFLDTRLNEKNF